MKLKLIWMAAMTVCGVMSVPVYADNENIGVHDDEFVQAESLNGHENVNETEWMDTQNPADPQTDQGIVLSDSYIEIRIGAAQQLSAEIPSGKQSVIWKSSDEAVVSVSQDGMLSAVSVGSSVIRAESADGQYSAVCTVDVIPVYAEEVLISEDSMELIYGQSAKLSASLQPADTTDQSIIWSSSDESVVTVDQNGNILARNPGTAAVCAKAGDDNAAANCLITVLFTDASDASRYFYTPVYWALQHDITNGYGGDGKFSPDARCTREQIVTFIWRMAGCPEPENYAAFTDVRESDWYYKAVSWAAEKGITVGLNDGTGRFGVGRPCTREMCVTFLWRTAGSPKPSSSVSFSDVKKGKYYCDPIAWAYENDVTTGLNDGTGRFGIGLDCTRAMVVSFLYRQYTGLSVSMDTFATVTDETGRSYLVYKKDGQIVKTGFKLNQTYYHVDPETGEIIHKQDLFTDRIFLDGIDISEHNGALDLTEFENGFVIIRVAWGTNADVLAKRNMDLCEQLKIPYGVYLYSYAVNDEQAESEADFMLDMIKGRDIRLGVWYDIEDDYYKAARISGWPNSTVISRHCKIFCDKVSAAGYHAGIYTSYYWFSSYIKGLNSYDRWCANWGYNDGSWAVDLNGFCSVHQYTSIPLDRNVFYVDPNLMSIPN